MVRLNFAVFEEIIKNALDSFGNTSIPVKMQKEIHFKLVLYLTKLFNDS